MVTTSTPVKALKTVKKTLLIDSADRDTTKYYTNGDFVVYLPRVYENVVSMRLVAGEFPPLCGDSTPMAYTHSYSTRSNTAVSFIGTGDVSISTNTYYFLIDIEGMNKADELAVGGSKSTFVDGYFAKIPALSNAYNSGTFIEYNDHNSQENIAHYSPAIGKLDRLHIRTRLHNQKDSNIGVLYWTTDGNYAGASTNTGANYNLTLEIEYLDNVFDDFSSLETHLTSRT
jgi:hypothetical protein